MKFKIEKNIPVPKKNEIRRNYPFGEMEVGDSWFHDCLYTYEEHTRVSNATRSWIAKSPYRRGMKFITRKWEGKVDGEFKVGIRVWREK